MKFKLVEYPYGRDMGFNQDIVWFIQGTFDNGRWDNYIWNNNYNSPSMVLENNMHRVCPPMSAYLTIKEANEAFDKIINYYREQLKEKPINILKEVEI